MRTSALFVAKNFGFFEIYGVSARTREVEPVRAFFGQEGVSFSRYCADVFYGRPLVVKTISLSKLYYYLSLSFNLKNG